MKADSPQAERPVADERIEQQIDNRVAKASGLNFDLVEKELRKRSSGVLGTVTEEGATTQSAWSMASRLPGACSKSMS